MEFQIVAIIFSLIILQQPRSCQMAMYLFSVGDDNKVIELEPDGTLVWEYNLASAIFTFRAEKYAPDYPAFIDKDLTPTGTIVNPPSSVDCHTVSSKYLSI